jgi:hypothetical protein
MTVVVAPALDLESVVNRLFAMIDRNVWKIRGALPYRLTL